MDRRLFLHSGLTWVSAVALFGSCRSPDAQVMSLDSEIPTNIDENIRPYLLASAESKRLTTDSNLQRGALNIQAVYARQRTGEPLSDEETKLILLSQNPISRERMQAMADYYSQLPHPENYGHVAGVGLGVMSALTSIPFPLASVVLGVASAVGEDAWNVVSTGGNLSTDLPDRIVYGYPADNDAYARANLVTAVLAAHSDPNFAKTLANESVKVTTGIDFSQSNNALVEKLPSNLKSVVIQAINESNKELSKDLNAQTDALGRVLDKFSVQMDEFEKQSKALSAVIQYEIDHQKRLKARNELAALQSDVNSGIAIATVLIGKLIGDPKKANQIGRVMSGVMSITFSLATGNILGAITGCLGLFGGGSDPMAPVMQLLDRIGRQIDQLRTEMHERFDRLEQQQQQILNALVRIYKSVNEGFAVTNQRLESLSDDFLSYRATAEAKEVNDSINRIVTAFSQAKLIVDSKSSGWVPAYLEKLPIMSNYAVIEARQPHFRGMASLTPGQLTKDVSFRRNADRLVAWIPAICGSLPEIVPTDIPNPVAAEMGVDAYLQADLSLGSEINSGRAQELRRMWKDAVDCRFALGRVSSRSSLLKLSNSVKNTSGVTLEGPPGPNTLVGRIRALEEEWTSQTMKSLYSKEEVTPTMTPLKEVIHYDPFTQKSFRIKNSPIDKLKELGWIKFNELWKRDVSGGMHGRLVWRWHEVEILKGPHAGYKHGKGIEAVTYPSGLTTSEYLDLAPAQQIGFFSEDLGELVKNGSQAPSTSLIGRSTLEFLDYCEFLLGYHYATEILPQFPAWLYGKGFSEYTLKNWSDSASALRLAAAIHRWRTFEGNEVDGQNDVRNIPLLSSTEEVMHWLDQKIGQWKDEILTNPASYTRERDPRLLNLNSEVLKRTKADLEEISRLPEIPESKSAPVVDRILRKLGTYMTAHQIPFDLPQK